ncbi:hypothetical protein NE683_02010 [Bariatricus massiliensis]|uniref:Uncharacterized protein n=1 Tax=Bariatricus massiliensis TaxID=1745713 RepID=A0ABS8DF10_9FIRM|nr:hypothetical protein [Bariatricus massiliensis]MCB7303119.1 hypothetical protein [Bariatricus massiliensis]MCB7374335.1 hypothetical protein [Bariatricus massiliensis]MCB7387005.1 hypothetical protein [Bariatricus massiliensis]MCB7411167.1 hypothetical protein [Bariatricus massiliensis]MCQ5251993.1 hypothetical protein [Bariatricus massiliensis]
MSILTEKQILKPYIKKATGYIKSLLSAQHVEMNNGITLQSTVDQINNNLTLLNSNLGAGGIVESGNGYVRYRDGTQLCWTAKSATYNYSTAYGSVYHTGIQYFEFAKAFITRPSITASAGSAGLTYVASIRVSSDWKSVGLIFCNPASTSGLLTDISIIAVGRWK